MSEGRERGKGTVSNGKVGGGGGGAGGGRAGGVHWGAEEGPGSRREEEVDGRGWSCLLAA